MKRYFVLALSMFFTGWNLAFPQFAPHEMFKVASYTNSNGRVIHYRVSAPQFPRKGKKYAIILALHGSGECGQDNVKQLRTGIPALMNGLIKFPEQVIVVVPQCRVSNMWVKQISFSDSYAAAPKPTLALKDAIEICDDWIKNRQADPDRFYIIGLSLGGFGVWDAIQREPERFAAAVPLCANGDMRKFPKGLKDLPIWVAHGSMDKNVPVACSRRMVQMLRQNGNKKVIYHEIENAQHFIWDKVYGDPDFQAWLLDQNRKNKPWWKFW